MSKDAVQRLLDAAYRFDSDVVRAGYVLFDCDGRKEIKTIAETETFVFERHCPVGGYVWGKVFRADLFRKICFPQGYWFEDMINSFLVSFLAKSVVLLPECLYYYRQHPKSITHVAGHEKKVIDTYWITELVMQEHELLKLPQDRAFFDTFINQVMVNANRLKHVPTVIQKSVFVLTCDLMAQYFDDVSFFSEMNPELETALRKKDYGLYRLVCNAKVRSAKARGLY